MTSVRLASLLATSILLGCAGSPVVQPAASSKSPFDSAASDRETILAALRSKCLNDFEGLQSEDPGFTRIAVDSAMLPVLCACADKGMRSDPWLDRIARMPTSERSERSKAATLLRQSYIGHGLECLPKGRQQMGAMQDGVPGRSLESIRVVFEQRAPQFYAAYRRALARHPGLSAKSIFNITIDPSGKVVHVVAQWPSTGDAQLEREVLDLVREMDFGAMEVATMVVTWPVDFRPE